MISLVVVALLIVFKPLVTKSELREENFGDSMYWQGVRFSLILMIPVLVLRSWKFKIGIYIALYIVMFTLLNDFKNTRELAIFIEVALEELTIIHCLWVDFFSSNFGYNIKNHNISR